MTASCLLLTTDLFNTAKCAAGSSLWNGAETFGALLLFCLFSCFVTIGVGHYLVDWLNNQKKYDSGYDDERNNCVEEISISKYAMVQ